MSPRRESPPPRRLNIVNGDSVPEPDSEPMDITQAVESFRLLVSRVEDYAIFLLDPKGNVVSWNEGAQRTKGYTADEIIGKHISTFYTPEDQKARHSVELLAKAERDGRVEEEGWRVRKDGTRFWADVVITALRDDHGRLLGFGKVTRDLTERREAEIAMSELAGRLLQLQDDERRRIARDLHDSTSPLITSLQARLYAARQKARTQDPVLADQLDDALGNAEGIASVVRTVSSLLHPPLLDEGGLLPSLKWYLEAYGKRTGLRIETVLPKTMPRLPQEIEITLFRVVQEATTTLMRHVGADRAHVNLEKDSKLILTIRLNAALPQQLLDARAARGEMQVGIAGMRERLRQMGGTFEITGNASETVVTATLPMRTRGHGD